MVGTVILSSVLKRALLPAPCRWQAALLLPILLCGMAQSLPAQKLLKRIDSLLTENYRKVNYDTAYLARPKSRWTVLARVNISGAAIETEGVDRTALPPGSSEEGQPFKSRLYANNKTTLSLGIGYQGIMLSLALNPGQLVGKYRDYELNLNCYRRNFGFDVIYQDAKNFTGWYDLKGIAHVDVPDEMVKVKTLNINAYYAFNNRRFSYPAAFSQSYIQRRSAGSFLLAASAMIQDATLGEGQEASLGKWDEQQMKMTNIGIGVGYGYNYVPKEGWLMHLSLLPTLIAYSNSKLTISGEPVDQRNHFPEFIATARGAVVKLWGNKYAGLSMVYNYTTVGDKDDLAIYNAKWRVRAFFGLRIWK